MKKLLIIIGILLIIFLGMYVYKNNINKNIVTVSEVEEIETYISKIYMWKEVTNEALPKFDNINNVSDLWLWEVVKKNLENYELTYNEIQEKSIEIFGEKLKKEFPKEGSEYIIYEESEDKYYATGIGLDSEDDTFLLNKIEKVRNGYKVEIIEYLEDYSESVNIEDENEEYNIYIKNLEGKVIATIKSSESENRTIEVVKDKIDKFTKKVVTLEKNSEGNIFVNSVE